MDYTKIPEPLIYQRRKTLHEFIDSNSLIAKLVENMVEIDYLNQYDFESSALNALNTACYICTIIMLDQNPEWRWAFFLRQAANSQNNTIDTDDDEHFVMELVYVLVRRFNKEWCDAHQQLMKKLFEYNFPGYRFDNNPGERAYLDSIHIIIGKLVRNLPAGNLPDDIFAPCDINDDAIEEAEMDMAQANMGWQDLTNNFDQKTTKILMDAICKNETERMFLALAIGTDATNLGMSENVSYLRPFFRKAIGMPAPDSADEQIDDLLWPPQIPEEDIDNATAEANGDTAVEKNLERIAALQDRIKELEEENQQLKSEKAAWEAEKSELTKKTELLVSSQEWYTGDCDELSADEIFTLRERLVFFSTVLSLEHDKKYTVAKNLEIFINELCNDQKNICPFFSKMKKLDEKSANSKAAKKVAGLMKLIIPEEYRNDKHITINKIIESMLLNYPENDDD